MVHQQALGVQDLVKQAILDYLVCYALCISQSGLFIASAFRHGTHLFLLQVIRPLASLKPLL